jgi:hypothetical protein
MFEMNPSRWLAIPIAIILAALPVFAGICDLRCASSQNATHLSGSTSARLNGSVADQPDSQALATCPLHAAGEAGSRPTESAPGPCHGPRDSRSGAVLVASASVRAPIARDLSPVFEAFALAPWSPQRTAWVSRDDSAFARSPSSSPLRSVLRI